jgi:hypothetical protein
MKLTTHVELDIEDFALTLEHSEALAVIKIIDTEQQSVDFTHECAMHFVKELLGFDVEWLDDIRALVQKGPKL